MRETASAIYRSTVPSAPGFGGPDARSGCSRTRMTTRHEPAVPHAGGIDRGGIGGTAVLFNPDRGNAPNDATAPVQATTVALP